MVNSALQGIECRGKGGRSRTLQSETDLSGISSLVLLFEEFKVSCLVFCVFTFSISKNLSLEENI